MNPVYVNDYIFLVMGEDTYVNSPEKSWPYIFAVGMGVYKKTKHYKFEM